MSCAEDAQLESTYLRGSTMGTSYNITLLDLPSELNPSKLHAQIDQRLADLNQQMSTYIEDSDIIRFNRLEADTPFKVKTDFFKVLKLSQSIAESSEGYFDITIGPLVELWGFGRKQKREVPDDEAIANALAKVGWKYLALDTNTQTISKSRDLWLDVSAVAKGYAVDTLVELLEAQGLQHFLVEIGGEMRVKGLNSSQQAWRIGIETPSLLQKKAQQLVLLSNKAIATSGDYRNYFEQNGERYSHTLDPASGRPIKHNIASVTVISDTAAEADAWATALNVLGEEKALALAADLKLAAYFILYADTQKNDGPAYRIEKTKAFESFLQ